ncbi:MAG: crosslink repair DNA glycosylase YcaQ family protein [Dyella sp.]
MASGAPTRPGKSLSVSQARLLQLAAQGLLNTPQRAVRLQHLVDAVQRMRLLQIDSIHVVARSPYLVLYSRLGAYPSAWLEQALAEGRLAECWAHEACFVSATDFPLHHSWREQRAAHWAHRHATRMQREHPQGMADLLARVERQGAVRASDFAGESAGGGWWQWKPEKRWLEAWFALGELMVSHRERFQRVYDSSARVLARLDPPYVASTQNTAALRRRFILDSVRALGISQARWIADYYRLKLAVSATELQPLVASGELLQVSVKDWAMPAYVHRDHAELLARAQGGRLRATHTTLLSPFDPLVWDRARALAMFDFEYTLECYLPQPKRRYGYYVLPILHGGRLIGRLDAKAHRSEGVFEVKALYVEPGVVATPSVLHRVAKAIVDAARWHATPEVRLERCQPPAWTVPLRAALRDCAAT